MGAMELMKEWYEQSGKMMNFLLNSFGNPGNPGNPGTGDEGSGGDPSKHETLWNGYLKNMEKMISDLSSMYRFDPERMDVLFRSWKDFQESMAGYFKTADSEKIPGLPSDIWAKWFEYAGSMNRHLFECVYDAEGGPSMTNPYSTVAGSTIRTGVPCDNISQLDEGTLNEMNEIISRYYAEVTKDVMAANEAVMYKNESAADKSQELMDKWVDSYDRFMKELVRTRAYNVILNDNLKMSLSSKKQLDDAMEAHWKVLGLPTRNDIMELHRTLHDLQLKLNRLHKDFKEFKNK